MKIAVFIDCENVKADFARQIFNSLAERGRIIIKRAFRGYNSGTSWDKEVIEEYGIELVHTTTHPHLKNSVDLKMQMNVLDTLTQNVADCYVIVSSDSDFRDLALRIKSLGLVVVGIGEEKTPKLLQKIYTEFIELKDNEKKSKSSPYTEREIVEKLKETIKKLPDTKLKNNEENYEGYKDVAQLGNKLRELDADFTLQNILKSLNIPSATGWKAVFEHFGCFECRQAGEKNSTRLVKVKTTTDKT